MKFPRAYLVFSNLEAVSNVVRVVPAMEGEPVDDASYGRTTLLLTSSDEDEVMRTASGVDQIAHVVVERCLYDAFLAPEAEAPAARSAGLDDASAAAAAGGAPGGQDDAARRAGPVEKTTIRVDTRKLNDLWSLIAELVLHKSHIARLSDDIGHGKDVHTVREELVESFDSLDKISSGMQQAMMDTRMIPISVIFSKFPRLVRDLSRKLGKPVELVLAGEDTEIDRSVVEALSDPAHPHHPQFPGSRDRVPRGARADGQAREGEGERLRPPAGRQHRHRAGGRRQGHGRRIDPAQGAGHGNERGGSLHGGAAPGPRLPARDSARRRSSPTSRAGAWAWTWLPRGSAPT